MGDVHSDHIGGRSTWKLVHFVLSKKNSCSQKKKKKQVIVHWQTVLVKSVIKLKKLQ